MKIVNSSIIYDNPLPQLRSRQAYFPFLCERSDGVIVASYAIGEAFESVDAKSCVSFSHDGGKTWSAPKVMLDTSVIGRPVCDYTKVTALPDGRIMALGYAYYRDNPDLPIGNPENGGTLDDLVYYAFSEDGGET